MAVGSRPVRPGLSAVRRPRSSQRRREPASADSHRPEVANFRPDATENCLRHTAERAFWRGWLKSAIQPGEEKRCTLGGLVLDGITIVST